MAPAPRGPRTVPARRRDLTNQVIFRHYLVERTKSGHACLAGSLRWLGWRKLRSTPRTPIRRPSKLQPVGPIVWTGLAGSTVRSQDASHATLPQSSDAQWPMPHAWWKEHRPAHAGRLGARSQGALGAWRAPAETRLRYRLYRRVRQLLGGGPREVALAEKLFDLLLR
jgi:hypothetical protein